jgi:hypothetical protein
MKIFECAKAAAVVFGLAFAGSAMAAPVFDISSGTLTLNRFLAAAGGETDDVRGLVNLNVSDGGSLVGPVVLADQTGGTDPGFTTLAFGNALVIGINAAFDQFSAVTFDFATIVSGATTADVTATGAPIATVTDPALTGTLGPMVFTFALQSVTPVGADVVATYTLSGVASGAVAATPEPATLAIAGLGLAVLGVVRWRRRKDQ